MKDVATDKEAEAWSIRDYIHEAVSESIHLTLALPVLETSPKQVPPQMKTENRQGSVRYYQAHRQKQMPKHLFYFHLIEPYVMAIKEAIEWDQDSKPPEKVKRFFPNLGKQGPSFPFMEAIWELMEDE